MVYLLAPAERRTVKLPDGFTFDTFIYNPGCAQRLIFFHGLGTTPAAVAMLGPLAARNHITIYAPSLPCHGASDDVVTFEDMIDRLAAWCDALDLRDNVMLGHSLGALVLPYLAHRRPDLVSSMICLAMPARPVANNLDLALRLMAASADSAACRFIMAVSARLHGQPTGSAPGGPASRTAKMIPILRQIPDMSHIVSRLRLPIVLIYGAIDLAARPPRLGLGLPRPVILGWRSHCFPAFDRTWGIIADQLALAY